MREKKGTRPTCLSMLRSSSWSFSLLLTRAASMAEGFEAALCPEQNKFPDNYTEIRVMRGKKDSNAEEAVFLISSGRHQKN